MNKTLLTGRLTREPEVRGEGTKKSARYTVAVPCIYKTADGPDADFITCVAFGNKAEYAEKYFKQGMRIGVDGHIQTGNYVGQDGKKVYTTDVVVDNHEILESKKDETAPAGAPVEEELPFS